jgi:preprotein translocase subunit SecG
MGVAGAPDPHSRDTPTGSHIGREPGFRKGFVIGLANVLRTHWQAVWGIPTRFGAGSGALDPVLRSSTVLDSATLRRVETIDAIIQVALAVVVILLVLMHSGKDSGLSGAFGVGTGTGPLGGGSLVERNLNRWTVFFAVLFFVNAIVLLKRPWG